MSVGALLAITAFALTILSAVWKVPLWVPVLLLTLIVLMRFF